VKLLLDENISRRLVPLLQASFPGTTHVILAVWNARLTH
jgi:predicted nuclease of predicted toxin-antitoxin system